MAGATTDDGSIFVVGSFVAACSVKVERLPAPGESLRAESFVLDPGGKGFNTAVAAHRLGARVDGVLAVGTDLFADFARSTLERLGLPAQMLVEFPGRTGAGVGLIDRHGENVIAVCPAANDLLSARDIAAASERIAYARFVIAQFEVADAPILSAFTQADRLGIVTILNPSPYRPISSDLLSVTNIVIANQTEAAALAAQFGLVTGESAGPDLWRKLAQRLWVLGVEILIVTLGARGVTAWQRGAFLAEQAAFPVQAVDTIGAGDAFLGGMLAALAGGLSLDRALQWGAACGALVSSCEGVLDALPDQSRLCRFLDERALA